MLQLRALEALGGADHDWLRARHHFAVDSQGNPAHARLGNLVVWNDDEIAAHSGFPMHGLRDMEIVTYVREGVLQHKDSSGGWGEIRPRNVQAITAGRGMFTPPKVWGERTYSRLFYWNEVPKGGHFAAFEQPELFVAELRKSFGQVR